MSYIDIADLAEASSFRRRLIPAVAHAATIVLAEEPTGKISFDNKRRDLARAAMQDPVTVSTQFVWGVLSNQTIAAAGIAAPDGDLLYQIKEIWSTVAGVTEAEENEEPFVPPTEI